jgi:hypothetical protein
MAAQVVCISRTIAALGEEIGNLVAERLSFRYVDEQVIERAARLAQVDPKLVAAVEHRQSLLKSLFGKLSAARDLIGPGTLAVAASGLPKRQGYQATPEDLRLLIRAAIDELAKEGQTVIVAHGASMTLATRPGVVRVLVTASAETRARRLAALQGLTAKAADEAVADSDRNRRDYFRRFYELAEEPTHYDLVLNTDVLAPEHAADVIVCAVQRRS